MASTGKRIASCVRTAIAIRQAAAAKAIDLRLGEIPAFAISRNASVEAG